MEQQQRYYSLTTIDWLEILNLCKKNRKRIHCWPWLHKMATSSVSWHRVWRNFLLRLIVPRFWNVVHLCRWDDFMPPPITCDGISNHSGNNFRHCCNFVGRFMCWNGGLLTLRSHLLLGYESKFNSTDSYCCISWYLCRLFNSYSLCIPRRVSRSQR